MNNPIPGGQLPTPDLTRIGRATCFAFVCVVAGIACLNINSCLGIPRFAHIFSDMLGENERLPALSVFVLRAQPVLLVLSCCILVAAIALLFTRNITRSLYCLGVLTLISMVEYAVVWHAKASPLVRIIEKMQEPSP